MATGTTTVDFGAFPGSAETFTDVTTSGLTSASYLEAFLMAEATADHSADEHHAMSECLSFLCEYLTATTFRVWARSTQKDGREYGLVAVRWASA